MPSLHEQEWLANRFEGLEKITYATSRALAKLKSTKVGLMQDLLIGDRRVTALLNNVKRSQHEWLHQKLRSYKCGSVNYRSATSERSTRSQ